jgi:uncharacterized protein with HEPN domain
MTVHGDEIHIEHIAMGIAKIREWARTRDDFFGDERTREAVLRKLQTIAESVQKVSDELKRQHPEVPWRDIASIRNVLVHDYIGLKLERIWDIVENRLPPLIEPINRINDELQT